ncbi:MAG TPA: universal stress protein [Dyella sp.]|uniref:universal stress protein n=1 Tax=Dyella sp. TaxID=1869338 RepID=UPI002BE9D445|nr:universal stress protein [Dyella sp.]HTV84635.1 universal stress protein [Dyella sp.]
MLAHELRGKSIARTHAADAKARMAEPQMHDILALATSTGPWSASLVTAIDIASRCNGNVTGCYVPGSLRQQRAYETDPTIMSLLTDIDYEMPDESAAFRDFAKRYGAGHSTWAVTRTAIAPTMRKLGAWHDVIIIERDIVDEERVFDILGEGMLSSRTPCIVLPPHWDGAVSFERIVIAWNGTYESTRALHSALPLIQLAKHVTLINGEMRPPYGDQVSVTEPDPITYLAHHGIAAKPHFIRVAADEAGKTILNKARETQAGLLVMGAYSHSRIRERVLGGATRYVLANADLPIFMQH